MAVRQYVGARYVPKFYQNSENPISSEWENGVDYEAMTVVTYNNSSYTSKIPVPAGIGNPASNPTYWVLTAAYNAQVEQYRQEVTTAIEGVDEKLNNTQTKLEGDMQTLKDETEQLQKNIDKNSERTFLMFGDSLHSGYTPVISQSDYKGWGYWVTQFLENKGYKVFHNIDNPGTGSRAFGSSTNSYTQALQYNLDNTNLKTLHVTDIVIYAGTNDDQFIDTPEVVENGIQEFVNLAKSVWPYAEIKIGYFGCWRDNPHNKVYELFKTVGKFGCAYIDDGYWLATDNKYISTDKTHLTQEGYKFYSPYLAEGAITGSICFNFSYTFTFNFEGLPVQPTSGSLGGGIYVDKTGATVSLGTTGVFEITLEDNTIGENISYTNPTNLHIVGLTAAINSTQGNLPLVLFENFAQIQRMGVATPVTIKWVFSLQVGRVPNSY